MTGRRGDDRGGGRDDDRRRGYRYRPADAADDEPDAPRDDEPAAAADADADADLAEDIDDEAEEEDAAEPPSEFWAAAELLKGAMVEDAELELSYAASVYANLPAAELRLWLRLPDGTRRMVQVDEPHAVWLYREAHRSSGRDFEEYPDQRFELLCTDVRATRARRQRQLIDRQLALHDELVAVGEELEELERDMREDEGATADWPGARWP
jgi:hypothetical protein